MWYKISQQKVLEENVKELDPTKSRQEIPSQGALEIKMIGNEFNMQPSDPPKLVEVQAGSGARKQIIILHGTLDPSTSKVHLTIPDESGQLAPATGDEFNAWRKIKGWLNYGWVACFGGKMLASEGADSLVNSTGTVYTGTYKDQEGNTILRFQQ
jgi:hypothetical protein